ncbi:hypothetical protein EP837_02608 [Sphingobium sp. EP60837]|nr:hypothetical protein EP837_02608 [Sphingobium sp. EP60837]
MISWTTKRLKVEVNLAAIIRSIALLVFFLQ